MKNKARLNNQSLNAYVEELIERDLSSSSDRYEALYAELAAVKRLPDAGNLQKVAFDYLEAPAFSKSDIADDPRLAAIIDKCGAV